MDSHNSQSFNPSKLTTVSKCFLTNHMVMKLKSKYHFYLWLILLKLLHPSSPPGKPFSSEFSPFAQGEPHSFSKEWISLDVSTKRSHTLLLIARTEFTSRCRHIEREYGGSLPTNRQSQPDKGVRGWGMGQVYLLP